MFLVVVYLKIPVTKLSVRIAYSL